MKTIMIVLAVVAVIGVGVWSLWYFGLPPFAQTATVPVETLEETTEAPQEAGAAVEYTVDMKDYAFDPVSLEIFAGEKVTWTNKDLVAHSVTADDGAFDSGELAQGETFSFTFTEPGTYAYHCTPHPNMTATITVQ